MLFLLVQIFLFDYYSLFSSLLSLLRFDVFLNDFFCLIEGEDIQISRRFRNVAIFGVPENDFRYFALSFFFKDF